MTKIVIPDYLTIFHSEAKRLREERDEAEKAIDAAIAAINRAAKDIVQLKEELAKVREVNAELGNQIAYWRNRAHHAEDQLRRAQQDRVRLARSGE